MVGVAISPSLCSDDWPEQVCFSSSAWYRKLLLQLSHMYVFSPTCVRRCFTRSFFCEYATSQYVQWNGFSPVCFRMCVLSWSFVWNFREQISHSFVLSLCLAIGKNKWNTLIENIIQKFPNAYFTSMSSEWQYWFGNCAAYIADVSFSFMNSHMSC